jgi:hypothetical protein
MPRAKRLPPITTLTLRRAKKAIAKNFGMVLTRDQVYAVLCHDLSVVDELGPSGDLDTLPREDLAQALLDFLLPGPPTVQDDLSFHQERWHWPMNASSGKYCRAFTKALKAAVKHHNIQPAKWLKETK